MSVSPYEAHERFPRQITPNNALQPTCERRTRLSADVSWSLDAASSSLSDSDSMDFRIVGRIRDVEPVAVGRRIRELRRLQRSYGRGRWRKMKGRAMVELGDGTIRQAEVHWYEAHGIGKKEFKLKLPFLDKGRSEQ